MPSISGIGRLLKDVVVNTLTTNNKTIPGAINELNTKITNSSAVKFGTASGLSAYYKANGNSVCIFLTGAYSGTLAAWERVTIGTLPEKYRPVMNMTNKGVENFLLFVNQNGTVQIQNGANAAKTYNGFAVNPSITYLL